MEDQKILYDICQEIGYDTGILFENGYFSKYEDISMDVREIIFTPPFMDAYIDYCMINYCDLDMVAEGKSDIENQVKIGLMNNLDNPVDFLDKLING